MDIEGEEFGVLKDMASEGQLCQDRINTITVEYHPVALAGNRTKFLEAVKEMKQMISQISQQSCKATNVVQFDDETYMHDVE